MPAPELQTCWVLHARPYRETSLLVDFLSERDGLLRCVARGARGTSRRAQQWRAWLQPFIPLEASWTAHHELGTLRHLEPAGRPPLLAGKALYCGLYANELLMRVLHPGEPLAGLLPGYAGLLASLAAALEPDLDIVLRGFELDLLALMGLCPDFACEAINGTPLLASQAYGYLPDSGFVARHGEAGLYAGEHLLAIGRRDFAAPACRREARRLMRQLLEPLLGMRPLASRTLFAKTLSPE